MKKIPILLVDDHTVVREGLRALLATEPDLEVVGEAENGIDAQKMAKKLSPEVIIMDVAMPHSNGLDATRQIRKLLPQTKILVLTSYHDDECITQLTRAGASGYLMKQTAANDLPRAIREVRRGNAFYSPVIAKRMRDQARDIFDNGSKKSNELTAREVEVLRLITEGYSNKETGVKLDISIKTVEKHRQQAMNKLGIHEVAGLTRYALAKGVLK